MKILYAVTAALNYENINNRPEKISDIIPFIDIYNWKEIRFPLPVKDWKKFENNNNSIALNVLFANNDKEEIKQAHFDGENEAILLMITDGKK